MSNQATLLIETDRVTEALELLKSALKTDPSNAEGHNNLGVLYYKQNKFDLS